MTTALYAIRPDQARAAERRLWVLRNIHRHWRWYGYGPSIRWLMETTDYESKSSVALACKHLEQRGYIERGPEFTARSMHLTPEGRELIGVVTLADFGPNPVVRLYGEEAMS